MVNDINIQRILFKIIEERRGTSTGLNKELEQLLCIENRSLRNRQRGDTYLSLPEFYRLARHYNISLEDIASILDEEPARARYSGPNLIDMRCLPLLHFDPNELKKYVLGLQQEFEKLLNRGDPAAIKLICSEVPLVYLMAFEELAYFKIYSYYGHIVKLQISFEEFIRKVKPLHLTEHFKVINEIYNQVDGEEIWDSYTFKKLLRLIEESVLLGRFEKIETLSLLLDQIDSLKENLKFMLLKGEKRAGGASVELFHFESVLRISFTLMGTAASPSGVFLKVFMIQQMVSRHPQFVHYMKKTFEAMLGRSNSISKRSDLIKNRLINILSSYIEQNRNRLLKLHKV